MMNKCQITLQKCRSFEISIGFSLHKINKVHSILSKIQKLKLSKVNLKKKRENLRLKKTKIEVSNIFRHTNNKHYFFFLNVFK